jgi:hypothetical protein
MKENTLTNSVVLFFTSKTFAQEVYESQKLKKITNSNVQHLHFKKCSPDHSVMKLSFRSLPLYGSELG